MKIAGLTWWRNNYGSVLQAYALQRVMNEFENIDYEILNQYSGKVASVDNFSIKSSPLVSGKPFTGLCGNLALKS
ncbi:hypothetical protein [Lacrimispora xylanisolvens]|uniref:hypothetical protein n=1 Tax=Lacrimispora xylanisolvens TaxID=384636 RepID=UPI0024027EB7